MSVGVPVIKVKKIVSFGYKRRMPPPGAFDVRTYFTYNPHQDEVLRPLTGLDPAVAKALEEKTPNYHRKYVHLLQLIADLDAPVAYLGCSGGRHRSVHLANKLGRQLGIPVEHWEL